MSRTVQVYRLWPDKSWDLVDVRVDLPPGLEDNDDLIESHAVQAEWLKIAAHGHRKPLQIGLYMLSIYGADRQET